MDEALRALMSARRIAVVGLDSRTDRVAYRIATYLQRAGYTIVPVHLGAFPSERVLEEQAYASLRDVPGKIDLVNVFVRSQNTGPVIEDAIAIGAGAIWLQQGIFNPPALARARRAGIAATQDRCTMVEHRAYAAAQAMSGREQR